MKFEITNVLSFKFNSKFVVSIAIIMLGIEYYVITIRDCSVFTARSEEAGHGILIFHVFTESTRLPNQ